MELRNQQRDKLKKLRKAERLRRKRKLKECQRRKFFDNPHEFTKAILGTTKSGEVVSSTGRAARALEENLLRSPERPITGAHRGPNKTY